MISSEDKTIVGKAAKDGQAVGDQNGAMMMIGQPQHILTATPRNLDIASLYPEPTHSNTIARV